MTLDEVVRHFNIRRLDNKFRVVVTERPNINTYVSVDELVNHVWQHYRAEETVPFGHVGFPAAMVYAEDLYNRFTPRKS